MKISGLWGFVLIMIITLSTHAQKIDLDYNYPKEYLLGGVVVEGVKYLDKDVLVIVSGLKIGEKITIPSEQTSDVVRKLWKQGLFEDVVLEADRIENGTVFLKIKLQEKPRVARFAFSKNIAKTKAENINDKIKDYKGKVYTENLKQTIIYKVKEYYLEKAYWDVEVKTVETPDTTSINGVLVKLEINPGKKVKIHEINFSGVEHVKESKLRRALKKTKQKKGIMGLFQNGKLDEKEYPEDKKKLIAVYNDKGYRDARIVKDSIYRSAVGRKGKPMFNIDLVIDEGNLYYFRDIVYTGTTKYRTSFLDTIVGIKRGDVYNQSLLMSRLTGDPSGRDVTSIYMDDGYLFFELDPIETNIENDSVDLLIRIREGVQAINGDIRVIGNTKTNDKVVLREVRTRPGQKFSRSDIIRTTQQLGQLGYFDAEQMGVTPFPNPNDGTVDIEYKVTERSSDQIELSGGWGAGRAVVSLGLNLTNFSTQKMFKKSSWRPIPSGDGQRLSMRAQTNGRFFQNFSVSFTEPWLGGKKPTTLAVSLYSSLQSFNGLKVSNDLWQGITIYGASVSLGKRLKWPDDYFTIFHSLNYQRYYVQNYQINPYFNNGNANNIFFKETLSRNSIDQAIYPRSGSVFELNVQFSPPYSLFNNTDYTKLEPAERYKLLEYHKWRFDAAWYIKIWKDLVLTPKMRLGFLGNYTQRTNDIPFGRFYVGGDGITGFTLDDRELIGLRGYNNNSVTPVNTSGAIIGGTAFQKFTLEARYPVSLNPQATIYVLSFVEAGNNYLDLKNFDPFNNKRSAGAGLRVFLPMFGMLGVDWGYGFDYLSVPTSSDKAGRIHVSIGQQF
jgi:outer membrane protein insertion porin family